ACRRHARDRPAEAGLMSERGLVQFGATTIDYTVVRSARRRKTIEITLDPAAGVLVAAPLGADAEQIRAIVTKRAGWIVRHATRADLVPHPREFISGESLPYLGRQVRLLVERSGQRVAVRFSHWSFQIAAPARLCGQELRDAIRR